MTPQYQSILQCLVMDLCWAADMLLLACRPRRLSDSHHRVRSLRRQRGAVWQHTNECHPGGARAVGGPRRDEWRRQHFSAVHVHRSAKRKILATVCRTSPALQRQHETEQWHHRHAEPRSRSAGRKHHQPGAKIVTVQQDRFDSSACSPGGGGWHRATNWCSRACSCRRRRRRRSSLRPMSHPASTMRCHLTRCMLPKEEASSNFRALKRALFWC